MASSPDLAAVDGLDSLFTEDTTTVMTDTGDVTAAPDITAEVTDWWTLQDAADNLNLSARSVLRWLKKGKLVGIKVQGTNGPEWRITPIDSEPSTVTTTTNPVMTDTGHATPREDITLVKELLQKIDVLTYRTGYLEAQLAAKDEHIKLLTDNSCQSWWRRFGNWMLGKQ
ncbi:MAG: helix-turn-helix domain-containing protein [Candidatus Melainabacteria bacterium]|nr:helix-turn-helix domain-containing protein [Candidatus Melainabacteria bacterium]